MSLPFESRFKGTVLTGAELTPSGHLISFVEVRGSKQRICTEKFWADLGNIWGYLGNPMTLLRKILLKNQFRASGGQKHEKPMKITENDLENL